MISQQSVNEWTLCSFVKNKQSMEKVSLQDY